MKRLVHLALVLLLPSLFSCAGHYYTLEPHAFSRAERPSDETARVVFLRPAGGLMGRGYLTIYDQDKLLGVLPGSSYFIYSTEPGKHLFAALYLAQNFDFLQADLAAGKTYYVFCGIYEHFVVLGKILAIKKDSDLMEEVDTWLPRLRSSKLTDEGLDFLRVREGERGKFVNARSGAIKRRKEIEKARNQWLKKADATQKAQLLPEDGI